MSATRYAIFFVPSPASALHQFGATALGYDSISGQAVGGPSDDELAVSGLAREEWRQLTAEPRKYGFHATLKAPFRLRGGISERDLGAEMVRFAAGHARPDRFAATIALLDGFVALVPSTPAPALALLAANCVRGFDRFRDGMTAAERSRRLAHPLTPRQIDHLDHWGYPYVFEDFRFHMTLTGRVPVERAERVLEFLRQMHKARAVPCAIMVDTIALLRQEGPDAPFRVIAHATLQASADAAAGAG
jgi:hypothetical protein